MAPWLDHHATSDKDIYLRRQAALATHLRRAAVDRRRPTRKQRISVGAILTGGNKRYGKVLSEIMTIGI